MAEPQPNEPNKAEQDEANRRLMAYRDFFTSSSGRLVLQSLRESLDGNTFRPDPYEAAYAAGRRSVYLNILQAMGQGEQVAQALALDAEHQQTSGMLARRAQLPATIEEL